MIACALFALVLNIIFIIITSKSITIPLKKFISAASLEEMSSSLAEISSKTSNNAESATQAEKLSNESKESADRGSNQMNTLLAAMNKIADSSKEMSNIIKVIDDIAFQTNLLALNAAVEAARAGRHGKGFAVVAEEVRSLASRSAKAASETSTLIEESLKRIANGKNITEQTSASLDEILANASKVAAIISEIASASNEQAKGISEINSGLHQVEGIMQQNAASAQENASSAKLLSAGAENLFKILNDFKRSQDDELNAETTEKALQKAPDRDSTIGPEGNISLEEKFNNY
ncbi:MAG: methyl-accepting chemotaxis protein [Planctomycetota bacterium]|jgi:methyl-accepting chemotaxis protein